ncbi:cytochrome c-type biogenesis protein [Vibrio sp. CAU 1672]|uniref:cytochrome c-type biogenesis protein n=1 Tax=Vibrio sp. CAU 1672 TaxID=3032594 RepID=UPI0023DB96D3|nr:cytochrome c-type biogenesis protein [Vibrio sp. CAU 1672]MDF2154302.1 cytochrome c-type biogenesis protein CcmH [Vibrio sp. CAU 1672]
MSQYSYFVIIFMVLLGFMSPVHANQMDQNLDLFEFHNADTQQRAITLAKTLRCPQCRNQNLIESNAESAKDLRYKVYTMINNGYSEDEVKQYLIIRYGDIILYDPEFNYSTALLWIIPLVLMIFFGLFSIQMTRH